MQFNNKNRFYTLPFSKNIGCAGIIIGFLIMPILLFLAIVVGLLFLGKFIIFYIYKNFKNKMYNNNNINNKNDNYTEAEYIDITNDEEDTKE